MATHPPTLMLLVSLAFTTVLSSSNQSLNQFIYNGFKDSHLYIDGSANIHSNGLLELTSQTSEQKGHAFYPFPLRLSSSPFLSTTFVFAINPMLPKKGGHGLAFVISSTKDFNQAFTGEFLGIVNNTGNGSASNPVFAIELDTAFSPSLGDKDDNHVGIDINSVRSVAAAPVRYYSDKNQRNMNLSLISGKPMQVWIEYNATKKEVTIVIAPLGIPKPSKLLLSKQNINLSELLLDTIYVGFSAATGQTSSNHYILGWSFNRSGHAENFDLKKLPSVPRRKKKVSVQLVVLVTIISVLLLVVIGMIYARRRKYGELKEDWEEEYAVQRFSYKELYKATKGFKDKEILGAGGFGKVYRGTLRSVNTQVAVKRISHDSRQGMKEFVSEVASMRRLRHRNLVPLLGYCRRKGELLLVYEYMANGSLDKFLFNDDTPTLCWTRRLGIIRGVASALLYLHEEWEQIVLHRDVKASNILLDANMDARLGDFGLARLYDHGTNPQTTHVVGTVGYLAPEISRTGKASTSTDVFAYGSFILEVACGRRPIEMEGVHGGAVLVDWVWECWQRGKIVEARDHRLEEEYNKSEMELVLKVGLLCVQPRPEARPSMRQVIQYLNGDIELPEMPVEIEEIGMFAKSTGVSTSMFSERASTSVSICYSTSDSFLQDGR